MIKNKQCPWLVGNFKPCDGEVPYPLTACKEHYRLQMELLLGSPIDKCLCSEKVLFTIGCVCGGK